jgi:hypothetical protein
VEENPISKNEASFAASSKEQNTRGKKIRREIYKIYGFHREIRQIDFPSISISYPRLRIKAASHFLFISILLE